MQGLSEEGCSTLLYRLPAMVPPVPAPQTNASTLCPLCCHISSPVFRWARKLARFSNWLANMLLGVSAALRRATLTKWSGCVMDTGLTFSTWAPVVCCLSNADHQAHSRSFRQLDCLTTDHHVYIIMPLHKMMVFIEPTLCMAELEYRRSSCKSDNSRCCALLQAQIC